MLVNHFSKNCSEYTNFEVWEVEDLKAFFKDHELLRTIFQDGYKFSVNELFENRSKLADTDLTIIQNILGQINDKHFLVYTKNDENHLDLINMQEAEVMNFGSDIALINPKSIYITIMDKIEAPKN